MKKSLIMATALVAVSFAAQAASIQWTINGIATKVLKDVQGNTAANTTLYFILADDLSSLQEQASQSAFESNLASLTLATATTTSEGKMPTVSKQVVTDNTALTAGTTYTFGLLTYSADSTGAGFYRIVTVSNKAYDASDPTSAQEAKTNFGTLTSASWTSAWTTSTEPVTPDVPEPATGALALAGVALLFKRRRA